MRKRTSFLRAWLKAAAVVAAAYLLDVMVVAILRDLYSTNPNPRAQGLIEEIAKHPGSGDLIVMMALVGGMGVAFVALIVVAQAVRETVLHSRRA